MIKVLLFAGLRDEVGKSELVIEIEETTISSLKKLLQTEYDSLNLNQVMIAVNEEYATEETIIKSGEVVAFIPPVSGG